jgi:hypothetical protein
VEGDLSTAMQIHPLLSAKMVPRQNAEGSRPPATTIDSIMSGLFAVAHPIQFSQPPISSHVVPLGEPLEDASAPRVGPCRTPEKQQ